MKRNIRPAALILPLLAAAMVNAQEPTRDTAEPAADAATESTESVAETTPIDFATIDKDSSGNVSLEEAAAVTDLHHAFPELDTDRNLALTPAEYAQWSRASKGPAQPKDPTTVPGGSAGAQHVPDNN